MKLVWLGVIVAAIGLFIGFWARHPFPRRRVRFSRRPPRTLGAECNRLAIGHCRYCFPDVDSQTATDDALDRVKACAR
jgi:hypothetical protein